MYFHSHPPVSHHLVVFVFRALSSGQCVLERSHVKLLSPVLAPEKVVCVGMNYRDHCLEQKAPIPKEPIIFSKFPSAITGPYDDIILPSESKVGANEGRKHPEILRRLGLSGLTQTELGCRAKAPSSGRDTKNTFRLNSQKNHKTHECMNHFVFIDSK